MDVDTPLRSPKVFQNAGRCKPPSELDERFPELFMQAFQGIEPQKGLLGCTNTDQTVDLDALCEHDKAGVVGRNQCQGLLDDPETLGGIEINQGVGKLGERPASEESLAC